MGNLKLKIWTIPSPLGVSDLVTAVSKRLKYPKSIYRYLVSLILEYLDTFRILITDHDFFQDTHSIVLNVKVKVRKIMGDCAKVYHIVTVVREHPG